MVLLLPELSAESEVRLLARVSFFFWATELQTGSLVLVRLEPPTLGLKSPLSHPLSYPLKQGDKQAFRQTTEAHSFRRFGFKLQTTPQRHALDTSFGPPSTSALDIIAHRTMARRHKCCIWGGNVTLENLFIEQLMSNKQLLKTRTAYRVETGRAEAAARREEVCRGGQKSCGVSQKVGERFPRRAAAKGGGR